MAKLLRITTVPESLWTLLPGQIAFMRQQGFIVWMASANGPEVTKLTQREGCPHFVVPLTRQPVRPLNDLGALWKTYWLIRQLRPDIVHTHTPKAGLIGMLAARMAGVPVRIHTIAGLPLMERTGLWRWLLVWVERGTYACATAVWPNSVGLADYIRQYISTSPKIQVIGHGSSNGVDNEYFKPTSALDEQAREIRNQLAIPANAFVWVFVGRIARDKGIDDLLTAFRSLAERQPNCRLLLVGYLETHDSISADNRAFVDQREDVSWVGYQADVRPYIRLANALVLPSYREGLPNVLLQAACLERPVIATDIVGCRDVIQPGETGLLVPPKDARALQEAMIQLMENPARCTGMGQRARAIVAARYNQPALWRAIQMAYRQALSSVNS